MPRRENGLQTWKEIVLLEGIWIEARIDFFILMTFVSLAALHNFSNIFDAAAASVQGFCKACLPCSNTRDFIPSII